MVQRDTLVSRVLMDTQENQVIKEIRVTKVTKVRKVIEEKLETEE